MIFHLYREQVLPATLDKVWAFFSDPRNLNEITPPDMHFEIITPVNGEMYAGQLIEYRIQIIKGIKTTWLTEITHVEPGKYFIDEQRMGPYKFWHHEHRFIEVNDGVRMIDHVTYAVGFGLLGSLVKKLWIEKKLNAIFNFRRAIIAQKFPKNDETII